MNRSVRVACSFLPLLGLPSLLAAGTINFENITGTGFTRPGQYTSLALNDGDGVTATFTRTGTGNYSIFDVTNLSPYAPSAWGNNALDPFYYYQQDNSAVSPATDKFLVNFSSPGREVNSVRIDYGDYGAGGGDAVFEAYDSGGNLIGTSLTQYWNGNLQAGQFGTFIFNSVVPISFIKFWGEGDPGNNTLFWDNLVIGSSPLVVVPLPPAAAAGLAGLGLVGLSRLRRRQAGAAPV